jgi:very-short-patch-repair endonuclease
MRWVTRSDQAKYMRERQVQNRDRVVRAEDWAAGHLRTTGKKWTRQAIWGCRLFDFWCAELGIAIEIDGLTHDKNYDASRDQYNYFRSGILVLRIPNFDEIVMAKVLKEVAAAETWQERKTKLRIEHGLQPDDHFSLVAKRAGVKKAHSNWNPKF